MARRQILSLSESPNPHFPLRPEVWERIKKEMRLSPQHARIIELMLRGLKCKQIGPAMGLAEPTLQTYLKRLYHRHGVCGQTGLLLHIMALSQARSVHPKQPGN